MSFLQALGRPVLESGCWSGPKALVPAGLCWPSCAGLRTALSQSGDMWGRREWPGQMPPLFKALSHCQAPGRSCTQLGSRTLQSAMLGWSLRKQTHSRNSSLLVLDGRVRRRLRLVICLSPSRGGSFILGSALAAGEPPFPRSTGQQPESHSDRMLRPSKAERCWRGGRGERGAWDCSEPAHQAQ